MTIWRMILTLLRMTAGAAMNGNGTEKEQARAKQYNNAKQRLILAGMLLSTVSGAIVIACRLPARISGRVAHISSNRVAHRSLFTIIITLLDVLASLPLGFYSGYVVEHRYQLSNQTKRSWLIDQSKGLVLALPFAVVIANVMLEIIERWPKRWWMIITALALPFTVLLSQLAPILIAPLFNRYEALKDSELAARIKALGARSGINVANVLQMDMSRQTKKANAFFAGMGRTRRIVLADTLLDNFTAEEIEVIVAHEMGHQAHHDLWRFVALGTVFTAALSFVVDLIANQIVRRYGRSLGMERLSDVTALPLLSWLLSLVGLSLAPLQNLYSRIIERRADTYALELTNNPAAFESTMQRLGELNLADPSPSKFVKYTMYSHPPIAERIERAHRFAAENRL
ncbi:MAG TPA: M48 family metallopeptidase [Nitrolancea sp.]|nr:M48 family metallopeptidase [Nitrolancea sp.]